MSVDKGIKFRIVKEKDRLGFTYIVEQQVDGVWTKVFGTDYYHLAVEDIDYRLAPKSQVVYEKEGDVE